MKFLLQAKHQIKTNNLHAIISTDADGDRPILIDENGQQINGDIIGLIAAKIIKADIVVTPITCSSSIEKLNIFKKVIRTPIGSPYVIKAMQKSSSSAIIVGFEANGGFLLGSDITVLKGKIPALLTRDAILPLILLLSQSAAKQISISKLCSILPSPIMLSNKIKNIGKKQGYSFLDIIKTSAKMRKEIHHSLENPKAINLIDGVRFTLKNENIIHFRQSGNAPEFRIYIETDSKEKSEKLLEKIMQKLKILLNVWDNKNA
jgi:phosphomannomutase